jgi:hypothetical protein
MPESLMVNRSISNRKSGTRTKRKVKLKATHGNNYPNNRENIKKIVEEEMKKNGYRRSDDPLIRDLKRLAEKYRTKMS